MFIYIITILAGYILGCFQSSFILSKGLKQVDIRNLGNGNAGASNAVISLGWKFGLLVALLDILKAIISLYLIKYLYYGNVPSSQLTFLLYLNGLFVILGHNYPFFMGFKGGKGTASLIGMLMMINFSVAIICIFIIFIITIITNYIALGTIGLVIFFVFLTIYLDYGIPSIIISILIAAMSIYKHLPNVKRIREGKEIGLRKAMKK
ncbi:glycerol-3-phosphate acyltransferase [Alkaliphilus peptidifermentans]|uniref:Glycerol-3-phosphate acyltransferase n=1 Tax=Alkaliphilus peptidifermentans DSM 18978 TaxID=1120976 RepID=A0A1G5FTS6_9FIRM|nr:glycerol-3-phosphate acyltransferase [Alkaliphilus peptidifermentans]SCY42659.1 glycerol-3-phosphate acyltransferase PlsY [Alkaliphilus peptidifermentans DSM 18978]